MKLTRNTLDNGRRINLMPEREAVNQPISAIICQRADGEGRKRVWVQGGAPQTGGTSWLSVGTTWKFINRRGQVLCTWQIVDVNPEPDEFGDYEFEYEYSGPALIT